MVNHQSSLTFIYCWYAPFLSAFCFISSKSFWNSSSILSLRSFSFLFSSSILSCSILSARSLPSFSILLLSSLTNRCFYSSVSLRSADCYLIRFCMFFFSVVKYFSAFSFFFLRSSIIFCRSIDYYSLFYWRIYKHIFSNSLLTIFCLIVVFASS